MMNIMNPPADWSTLKKLIWLRGTPINGGEELTVSGTPPLSLTNSLGKPLKAWSVDLLPYQEGTGDPSPDNVRPIHGTDKLNLFVEESYDQSATPKAVLTLPQTVYTGTIGSEGGESRWGKIVLDGSETWGGSNAHGMYTQVDTLLRSTNYTNIIKCESLKTYKSNSGARFTNQEYGITGWAGTGHPGQNWIYIAAAGATTTTELKAWLAQNPVTVVFELATPTTFTVPSATIPTPTGTATTWATAEDGTVESMEVTYVGKA